MNKFSDTYDWTYNRKEHYKGHYTKSPYYTIWKKVAEYISVDDTVVDIGCGTGQLMELLLDRGIGKYYGYDFSPVAINLARSRIKGRDAVIYLSDLYELKKFEDANVYVSVEVMEHLKDDIQVLSLIDSGKRIVITVPNYLGGSHVRKFESEQEVINRYEDIIIPTDSFTIKYGSGLIFVLSGVRK